jgi:pullulanase/glycogen debranching enzyme
MVLYRADGKPMGDQDWQDASAKTLAISLDGRQIEDAEGDWDGELFLVLVNAHFESVAFTIPGQLSGWEIVLSSLEPAETPALHGGNVLEVPDRSFLLLMATSAGATQGNP